MQKDSGIAIQSSLDFHVDQWAIDLEEVRERVLQLVPIFEEKIFPLAQIYLQRLNGSPEERTEISDAIKDILRREMGVIRATETTFEPGQPLLLIWNSMGTSGSGDEADLAPLYIEIARYVEPAPLPYDDGGIAVEAIALAEISYQTVTLQRAEFYHPDSTNRPIHRTIAGKADIIIPLTGIAGINDASGLY